MEAGSLASGFAGKFYIFYAAVATGHTMLAIIGVLASLLSVYYYLRPVVAMYFHSAQENADPPRPLTSGAVTVALVLAAVLVLILGILPSQYLDWAGQSVLAG